MPLSCDIGHTIVHGDYLFGGLSSEDNCHILDARSTSLATIDIMAVMLDVNAGQLESPWPLMNEMC